MDKARKLAQTTWKNCTAMSTFLELWHLLRIHWCYTLFSVAMFFFLLLAFLWRLQWFFWQQECLIFWIKINKSLSEDDCFRSGLKMNIALKDDFSECDQNGRCTSVPTDQTLTWTSEQLLPGFALSDRAPSFSI